jgi:hypothetical protein
MQSPHHDAIQEQDDGSAAAAAAAKIEHRIEEQRRHETRQVEAEVRALLNDAERVLANESETIPERILRPLHWLLWLDDTRETVLDPDNDTLDPQYKRSFKRLHRDRTQGIRPDPHTEYTTLVEVATAEGYISSITDKSQYAPVYLESITEPSARSVSDPTPIGRRRIAHDDPSGPSAREVVIPHQSCDHILAVALPRSGKDSTLTSLALNLQREHGYSFFSILDDGRMETPMVSIPADEDAILDSLDRFGQSPQAMNAEVYVPAMEGLPDALPANFRPFTISIDSLTPNLILRLAGVTTSDATCEQLIKKALDETLNNSGAVHELLSRLNGYSEGVTANIEWTEVHDTGGTTTTEDYTTQYEIGREKALKQAAQRLAQLAGEGLIASPSAATNIDMPTLIADQDTATVLCCNFLNSSHASLKYTIMDLWLRLIYRARDTNPRLPRVCLGIRELKNVAPSKLADVRYRDAIKTLRQTIFFLSTQGGSRRILLLGSTQKLNDVYKPVRTNMATKLLLRLGEEEIETLDRSYHFSREQKRQLSEFSIGMGMVMAGGDAYWPIEFRGAPCGLGLGDQHWLDRYGKAWGARVRQSAGDNWQQTHGNAAWWVHTKTATTYAPENRPPRIGDIYSEWYLLPQDFDAALGYVPDREEVTEDLVQTVLAERREHEIPARLAMEETGAGGRQKSLALDPAAEETTRMELAERHNLPQPCYPWLEMKQPKRQNLIEALHVINNHDDLTARKEIAPHLSYPGSTFGNYTNDDDSLGGVIEKQRGSGRYTLTPAGEAATNVDWDAVEEDLAEADI